MAKSGKDKGNGRDQSTLPPVPVPGTGAADVASFMRRLTEAEGVSTNINPTLADVKAALVALGDTPDAVAEALRAAGVRGVRSSCSLCPVASHLSRVFVGQGLDFACHRHKVDVQRAGGHDVGSVVLPGPVRRFVSEFDHGIRYEFLATYEGRQTTGSEAGLD